MYKYGFSVLVLLGLLIQPAIAQKGFHAGVNFGILSPGIFDKKNGGDLNQYDFKIKYGTSIGIAAGNNFTDKWGVEVEANYAQMGGDFHNSTANTDRKIDLNYYQVPVLLKFTGGNYTSRFSAMIGPQFNFLASAKKDGVSVKDKFNSSDVGLLVTAGGDITLTGDLYLNLALRGYYGFSQINKDNHVAFDQSVGEEQLHNAYIGFNIGLHYMFRDKSERPESGAR